MKSEELSGDLKAEIAKRAYEIWEAEGRGHGHDLAHWFQAENEIFDNSRKSGSVIRNKSLELSTMTPALATRLIIGADEVASETQVSAGWAYAVFPAASIQAIDKNVMGGSVKSFHGRKFKQAEAAEYAAFLKAVRAELEKEPKSLMLFTLQSLSWKNQFVPFAERLISGAMKNVGVSEPAVVQIAEHLFPGIIYLQRLLQERRSCVIELEVDSDSVSEKLKSSMANFGVVSVPTSRLLTAAYDAYRKEVFPDSPAIARDGIRALRDAKSRAIQAADVFGNFALAYLFRMLGHTSKSRAAKAQLFENAFGDILDISNLPGAVKLSGANDIEIVRPGGLTLVIGLQAA